MRMKFDYPMKFPNMRRTLNSARNGLNSTREVQVQVQVQVQVSFPLVILPLCLTISDDSHPHC